MHGGCSAVYPVRSMDILRFPPHCICVAAFHIQPFGWKHFAFIYAEECLRKCFCTAFAKVCRRDRTSGGSRAAKPFGSAQGSGSAVLAAECQPFHTDLFRTCFSADEKKSRYGAAITILSADAASRAKSKTCAAKSPRAHISILHAINPSSGHGDSALERFISGTQSDHLPSKAF